MMVALLLPFVPVSNHVFAEGPSDPAPEIKPKVVNDNAGKKILFDNTHGQTAGAADWVIDGGFSDFANGLAEDGFYVKELRKNSEMNYDDLKSYDAFVIGEANIPYKSSEQAAMVQYVKEGGSIFFIGDHYNADRNKNRWDASEVFNGYRRGAFDDPTKGMGDAEKNSNTMKGVESSDWLKDNFGVRFRYNALGDVNADQIVSAEQSLGITEGVKSVAMHAGSTLAIADPEKAKGIVYLPKTDAKWPNAVDQGVYEGGGMEEGPYAAIAKVGKGKAAFIGDSSPVEDASPKYLREETGTAKKTYDGYKEVDDGKLLINTMNWLTKQENYTRLSDIEKLELDKPTSLLDIENPATSTEPKPEPWAPPSEGYHWWDPSTFKPGSYGSPKEAPTTAVYGMVRQETLPNKKEFKIRAVADNMAAGSTVSGLQIGIYLAGGQQVAKIKNEDGTWPPSYGYSEKFSLTANEKGHAAKELTVSINPAVTGQASLRLRLNGSNLNTESVSIADVDVQPLPDDGPRVPEKISVAEARGKKTDDIVTVEGTITSKPGLFGGLAFYLQDETAGIYVYQSEAGFEPGDKVTVSGKFTVYNGEKELTDILQIKKVGTSKVPEPKTVTAISEENQGQLVRMENVTVRGIEKKGTSFEFNAVADDKTTRVRVDGRSGYTMEAFNADYPEGTKIHLLGLSSIFNDQFQLKPRSSTDFAKVNVDNQAPVTEMKVIGNKLSRGEYLQQAEVTLQATDDKSSVEKIEYRLNDNEPWTTYEKSIRLAQAKVYPLEYRATDQAGNTEESKKESIRVIKATMDQLKSSIQVADIKLASAEKLLLQQVKIADLFLKKAEKAERDGHDKLSAAYRFAGRTQLDVFLLTLKYLPSSAIGDHDKSDLTKIAKLIRESIK
ncbi:OmpL47-type beta-barrel domain-containing protein [Marininema mesophilum]